MATQNTDEVALAIAKARGKKVRFNNLTLIAECRAMRRDWKQTRTQLRGESAAGAPIPQSLLDEADGRIRALDQRLALLKAGAIW